MIGKHVKSEAPIHYYTNGFNFTLTETDGNPASLSGNNRVYIRRYTGRGWTPDTVKHEDGADWYYTYYYIPWNTIEEDGVTYPGLLDTAERLAKAGSMDYEAILSNPDGITLYMNNVFQCMRRTATEDKVIPGQERIETLREMKSAQPWSSSTMDLLGAYYDIPLKIQRIYYPTYKVHTNCTDCAALWIESNAGSPDWSSFEDAGGFCPAHNPSSGIWCERTFYGDKDGEGNPAFSYTKPDGVVRQIQATTYTVRNGAHAGEKWKLDCTCDDWSKGGAVTGCASALYLISGSSIVMGPYSYGNYGSGAVYELYAYGGSRLQIKVDGSQAGNRERVIVLPYKKDIEEFEVKVKYVTVTEQYDGSYKGNTAVKTVEGRRAALGQAFSYISESEMVIGSDGRVYRITDDENIKSVYAYGSTKYTQAAKGTDSLPVTRIRGSSGYSFRTDGAHSRNETATLYIPVEAGAELALTVKYVDESGSIIKDNVAVMPVEKGAVFSYTADISSLPGGTEFTGKGKYVYGSKAVYSGSGIELTASGSTFTNRHTKNTSAVLFIKLRLPGGAAGGETSEMSSSVSYFDASAAAALRSEIFDTALAIPSTEEMYAEAEAAEYLISCGLRRVTGAKTYTVSVVQPYVLKYKSADGKADRQESGSTSMTVNVVRSYTYTELSSLDFYILDSFTINNGAIEQRTVNMAHTGSMPSCSYRHYSGEAGHVQDPAGLMMSVTLPPKESSSDTSELPSIPAISTAAAKSAAESAVGRLRVRNDSVSFGSGQVLSDIWAAEITPAANLGAIKAPGRVLLKSENLLIPADITNKTYASSASAAYRMAEQFSSARPRTLTFPVSIESVSVHTPVYCEGIISADNSKYVQTCRADYNKVQLVLGRSEGEGSAGHENDANDFTVEISNTGQHLSSKGYGSRSYSSNISGRGGGSYIARDGGGLMNQVRFPFDVFMDVGGDFDESNDRLIAAGTWYTLGLSRQRFYLPMWVAEGNYSVDFRSVAVNSAGREGFTQEQANISAERYAAVDSVECQVSGRLYGFTLLDINSRLEWEDVFRIGTTLKYNFPSRYKQNGTLGRALFDMKTRYYYTVGDANELGLSTGRDSRFLLPLIAGSSPKHKNLGVLKAGYKWRFKLETVGSKMSYDNSGIVILPEFWWVSEDGRRRERAELYYTEYFNGRRRALVKVGSSDDLLNVKQACTGGSELAVPASELIATASARGSLLKQWAAQKGRMYTYGKLSSNNIFKTFSNRRYADMMLAGINSSDIINRGYTRDSLTRLKQTYYFEYSLPQDFHAVPAGFDIPAYIKKAGGTDYSEAFWKKGGYIVVSFRITAHDYTGADYMCYGGKAGDRSASCNMWLMEGFKARRTDYYGTEFNFSPGDVFMVYTDKTLRNDYATDHLN